MTRWRTDETCPDCGTPLTLEDDGRTASAECCACGYAYSWPTVRMSGGDQ